MSALAITATYKHS